jgi:hypothetical protein
MCVAVIIEDNKRIPAANLKAMHEANSDGGGLAWMADGVVHFRKGLTWEQIDALQERLPRPFLLHFRIATRGPKVAELTHPFPLGEQAFSEDLTGISDKGVIIHNGTWPDFKKYIPEGVNPDKCSDTQVAAYVAAWDEAILTEVRWSNAIMKPDGVWYRGSWERFEGNLYSNMHWKRELYDWSNYRNWQARGSGRTPTPQTPIVTRKKGSHRDNRNQENGRTVGQYQTQFNKGGNTVQSNGKTVAQNRAEKRKKKDRSRSKTEPMGVPSLNTAYEQAKANFEARQKQLNGARGGSANIVTTRATEGDWDGERLFQPEELPGYTWNEEGKLVAKNDNTSEPISFEKYLSLRPGKSVKCDDCKNEITQIPCECQEMDAEEKNAYTQTDWSIYDKIEQIEELVALGELDEEQGEIAMEALLATGESSLLNKALARYALENVSEADDVAFGEYPVCDAVDEDRDVPIDLMDVEDMNDYGGYGMGLGMDHMGESEPVEPVQPEDLCLSGDRVEDWGKVDAYIRSQGIKI